MQSAWLSIMVTTGVKLGKKGPNREIRQHCLFNNTSSRISNKNGFREKKVQVEKTLQNMCITLVQ